MANLERGQLAFHKGVLHLTTNRCCEMEAHLGMPYGDILITAVERLRHLRVAISYGYIPDNGPQLTLDEAGDLIDEVEIKPAATKVMEAFRLMQPSLFAEVTAEAGEGAPLADPNSGESG